MHVSHVSAPLLISQQHILILSLWHACQRRLTGFFALPPFLPLEALLPRLQSSSLSAASSCAEAATFFWPLSFPPGIQFRSRNDTLQFKSSSAFVTTCSCEADVVTG